MSDDTISLSDMESRKMSVHPTVRLHSTVKWQVNVLFVAK